MKETTVKALLRDLTAHFGEPVRPVSKYCEALITWARVVQERVESTPQGEHSQWEAYASHLIYIIKDIHKSNLLDRLIYGGENLRTEPCPKHKGRWSGILPCELGCDSTGWLPEPKNEPQDVTVVDVIETGAVVTPAMFRGWVLSHGWEVKDSSHNAAVQLCSKEGFRSFVVPKDDKAPAFPRFIEHAINLISDQMGTTRASLLLQMKEHKTPS